MFYLSSSSGMLNTREWVKSVMGRQFIFHWVCQWAELNHYELPVVTVVCIYSV